MFASFRLTRRFPKTTCGFGRRKTKCDASALREIRGPLAVQIRDVKRPGRSNRCKRYERFRDLPIMPRPGRGLQSSRLKCDRLRSGAQESATPAEIATAATLKSIPSPARGMFERE